MTPWEEYVAAAQRLDLCRRAAAAAVAEQAKAQQAARDDLAAGRARQALQQARLLDTARQAGGAPPVLVPQPADLAAAQAALGPAPTPQAIRAGLYQARVTLDTADAALSATPRPPVARNALIYGGYALLAAVLEVVAFLGVDEASAASVLVLGCGLVLPVFAFALGWLTVGALPDRASRTPGLGAAMSLLALVPLLAMVVWVSATGR